MITYKLLNNENGEPSGYALNVSKSIFFKISSNSREAKVYEKWLAEGNEPLPADEPAQ